MRATILALMTPFFCYLSAIGFLVLRRFGFQTVHWALAFFLLGTGYAITLIPPAQWSATKPLIEDTFFLFGAATMTVAFTRRFGAQPRRAVMGAIIVAALLSAALALHNLQSVRLETLSIQAGCTALLIYGLFIIRHRVANRGDRVVFWSFTAVVILLSVQCIGYAFSADTRPVVGAWTEAFWGIVFQVTGIALAVLLSFAVFASIILDLIEKLGRVADTDVLTDILNRRGFEETSLRLHRTAGSLVPSSVMVVDIDRFKSINDAFGHSAGDTVIVGMARLLTRRSGDATCVGRTGGEEFGMFLGGCDLKACHELADQLRADFSHLDWQPPLANSRFTASFGAAQIEPGEEIAAALRRADNMLYLAKNMGRNRVVSDVTFGAAPPPVLTNEERRAYPAP